MKNKIKVGDTVTITGKITVVDDCRTAYPYRVDAPNEDHFWASEGAITSINGIPVSEEGRNTPEPAKEELSAITLESPCETPVDPTPKYPCVQIRITAKEDSIAISYEKEARGATGGVDKIGKITLLGDILQAYAKRMLRDSDYMDRQAGKYIPVVKLINELSIEARKNTPAE